VKRRDHVGSDHLLLAAKRKREELEWERKLGRIMLETGLALPRSSPAKLPGDPDALRGIPMVGRGIGGAMRGTKPGTGLE
jgi:hypothetical protein